MEKILDKEMQCPRGVRVNIVGFILEEDAAKEYYLPTSYESSKERIQEAAPRKYNGLRI